jgi:tetratricopeptide (TPR) repeat protein
MSDTIQELLARRNYDDAIPLLQKEIAKYPTNYRLRLQLADALAGSGQYPEALEQYDAIVAHYEKTGLIVQAIGVRKKAEKVRAMEPAAIPAEEGARSAPPSPLFESMNEGELDAVISRMTLEHFGDGDIVITEGEAGASMYVIVSGEVKVFTRGQKGESLHLATLGEGDFFGEVSVLTGRPRTATITASAPTELLRLDKDALDELTARMPRIREVLDEFYQRRAKHTVEAMIESMKGAR